MFRWIRELSQRNTWHLLKSNQCFQRVLVWKMSGEHCSPLDIAKSDAATNVKMSRRIGLREWQKSGSWAESCELFSRESRDVLSVRCRKYLLVEYASSTVDYLWNMAYTIYILFFFGTENRCNISRTLIGCIKRIYNIYNYCINSIKLSFNIYIYNSVPRYSELKGSRYLPYFSFLSFTIIQKILHKFLPKYQITIKSLIKLSSFVRNENEKWKFSTWSKITQKAIN